MTFQAHKPYPAGQCFGPQCTATAREKDKDLIPRFCSDPCRDRFVVEHAVRVPGAVVTDRELADSITVIDETHTHTDADLQEHFAQQAARLSGPISEWAAFLTGLLDGIRDAADAIRKFGLITKQPPTDPKARALWLRQHGNTGPASKRPRAPRLLDTTARRRTR